MGQRFENFAAVSKTVAEGTNYWITPANVVSPIGLGLSIDGSNKLGTWSGICETAIGFGLDVADGALARATDTASPKGEILDATLDKIKVGYFALKLFQENRAPKGLIGAVAAQNSLNAAITLYDKYTNEIPRVHPVKEGKRGMFAQNLGLGLHAVGTKLTETHPAAGASVKKLGSVVGYSGVALSLVASAKYARAAGLIDKTE